jgi:hypothetical protein
MLKILSLLSSAARFKDEQIGAAGGSHFPSRGEVVILPLGKEGKRR